MGLFKKLNKRFSNLTANTKKELVFEFHKHRNQLIIIDKVLFVLLIMLLGLFRPDTLVIFTYFMLYPYLFLTKRKNAILHLIVSSLISIIWVIIANNQYGYNREIILIFGLNSFPLFAWSVGLFGIYLIYSYWEHKLKDLNFISKLIIFSIVYIILLIAVETIAYHLFNIQDLATAMYPGLPICNCIHAPIWMQISYLLMGSIYFTICSLLGLENPSGMKIKK